MDESIQQTAPLSNLAKAMLKLESIGDSHETIVKRILGRGDNPKVVAGAVKELGWIEPDIASLLIPSGADNIFGRRK